MSGLQSCKHIPTILILDAQCKTRTMYHNYVQQVISSQMSANYKLRRTANALNIADFLFKKTLEDCDLYKARLVFNRWLRSFISSWHSKSTQSVTADAKLLVESAEVCNVRQPKNNLLSGRTPADQYFLKTSRTALCDINPTFRHIQSSRNQSKMLASIYARFFSTADRTPITSIKTGAVKQTLDPRGEKHIKIKACAGIYTRLAKSQPKLFASTTNNEGIDFVVRYYDSAERLSQEDLQDAPTVCLLHGAPGTYEDFASLIDYLTTRNVRVIAPNFPTYSTTLDHGFRHSPPERADYLSEFFKAINLERIDLLIGHSSAIYTIFEVLNQSHENLIPVQIRSLGLFSTPSYNLPPNLVPTPLRLFMLHMFDYPLFRPVIMTFAQTIAKFQGIRNRVDKDRLDSLLIGASAIGYSFSDNMAERLKLVIKSKIPTFVLIGCNDKIIPMENFEQLKRDLGIVSDDQVRHYGDDGQLSQDVKDRNELVNVCQFSTGGHYAFQRFTHQVNSEVYNFLTGTVLKPSVESTKL